MTETDELEPQQYQRQYWEDDVPLRDVRDSTLRKFVYLGTVLFIGFILAGCLVKFPDEVQLPFIFKTEQPEDIYRFPYPVYLTDKYIRQGDAIKKGSRLLQITSPEITAMVNNLNEARQNLENYHSQKSISVEKQKEIITIKIDQDREKITQTQKELSLLESKWKSNQAMYEFKKNDAEHKLEQNRKLYAARYISSQELKQYETNVVIAADSALTAKQIYEKEKGDLSSHVNQCSLDIASLENELIKLSVDTKYDSVQLTNQLELTDSRIKNTFGEYEIVDGGVVVIAREDGVASFLFEGDKEIQSGSILLKMRYTNTPLYSIISVPPSLVGKLQPKQHVFLKVATFPAYEWGAVAGHIDNISLTPDEKGFFNVRVVVDEMRKLNGHLQSGMNGNATIVLSEKTFFEYFFRSVKKGWYTTTMNN